MVTALSFKLVLARALVLFSKTGGAKIFCPIQSHAVVEAQDTISGASRITFQKKSVFVHDLCFTSLPHHFEERLGIFILININF